MSFEPLDNRDGWIWMDGEFVPWRDARVHVLTHALHYASSVFEGERMYDGEIFKLTDHTERLFRSAELLDFRIPYSVAEIDEATRATCVKNGLSDCYIRPLAWRGSEQLSVSAFDTTIHVAIAAWAWPSYFSGEEKKKGIRATWAKWARPAPNTAPVNAKAAGLYMICTMSKMAAERAGYPEALMLDWRGYVAEATGANVFFVKDGVLHTPNVDAILNGVTRLALIDLANERGYEVVVRDIRPDELASFQECFICGTAAEVTPVNEIGDYRFTPGTATLTLMDDYYRLVRRMPKAEAA